MFTEVVAEAALEVVALVEEDIMAEAVVMAEVTEAVAFPEVVEALEAEEPLEGGK